MAVSAFSGKWQGSTGKLGVAQHQAAEMMACLYVKVLSGKVSLSQLQASPVSGATAAA